jgi:hypothetical protein
MPLQHMCSQLHYVIAHPPAHPPTHPPARHSHWTAILSAVCAGGAIDFQRAANIVNPSGLVMRADSVSNFAYMGVGTGTLGSEQFYVYSASNPDTSGPVTAGSQILLRQVSTGMWGRLGDIPAGYGLASVKPGVKVSTARSINPSGSLKVGSLSTGSTAAGLKAAATKPATPTPTSVSSSKGVVMNVARGLLESPMPTACNTQGLLFDSPTQAGASPLTYTGSGFTSGGVNLVSSPMTQTLVLSNEPECTSPGGAVFMLQGAEICRWRSDSAPAPAAE